MEFLIKHAEVYKHEDVLKDAVIYIKNGRVREVWRADEFPGLSADLEEIDAEGLLAIPGFIDTHIHGAKGADVMDGTPEALETIAEFLPEEGTTSFLATTITQAEDLIEAALENAAAFRQAPGQAELVGIHLEGPFVELSKAGAQPKDFIRTPDAELLTKWQELSEGKIKVVTFAPELDPEGHFIRCIEKLGAVPSAGHTAAAFADMKKANEQGVRQLTHLANAMNGIHHRDVGAVGAAFLLDQLNAELIADGIHLSHEMLEIIFREMGSARLLLITDAMRAKGLPPGEYELGGQPVQVSAEGAYLSDGTLAGSVLTMQEAAQNMHKLSGCGIRDIIRMTAENPARTLGVYDRKGSITPGKDADILLTDCKLAIKHTFVRGKKVT